VSPIAAGPYADSGAHLRDELARVDLLVRAQVQRWRLTIGAAKPEHLWGMIHVSDDEITQYLASDVAPPDRLLGSLAQELAPFWERESEAAATIRSNVDATPKSVELRLERLRKVFALTDAELDVVLLAFLPELDLRYGRIYGYLQDDASRSHLPVSLAGEMLHPKVPSLEMKSALFEPDGNLLRWHLVSVGAEPDGRGGRMVRLDERIASFLAGHDGVAAPLENILHPLPADVQWKDVFADAPLIDALRAFAEHDTAQPQVVVLHGSSGSGRAHAARAICAARGVRLFSFDVESGLRDPAQWNRLLTLAYREALLQNAALYFDGVERLDGEDRPPALLESLTAIAERSSVLTFLAVEATGEGVRAARLARYPRFDFVVPHYALRREIWKHALPPSDEIADQEAAAAKLAAAFQLTAGQIVEAVTAAKAIARRRSPDEPRVTLDDLHEACRRQSGRRLLGFANRIEPTRRLTLDDIIVSNASKVQLRELMARVRLRSRLESEMSIGRTITHGQGLLVLFAGPSGTGKTLAAEVIANQQGVDLYKVDVSTVVSKWVGETEKNLARVFADAEGSDAILFFDECDSLFGQRGEISEARDRWANLQTNYLLQRVEEYSGVVIMATNLRKNLDDAFLRRIQIILEFPAPDAPLRFEILKRAITEDARAMTEDQLRQIADRFSITGGSIRNIAVEASYRALANGRTKLELRDVIDAIAREYQKLGKPITKSDFGEQFYDWVLADVISPAAV